MTGHNSSGYIARLWRTLFVSLLHFFALVSQYFTGRNPPSGPRQQPHSPEPPTDTALPPGNEVTKLHLVTEESIGRVQGTSAQEANLARDDTAMGSYKKRQAQKRQASQMSASANGANIPTNQQKNKENFAPNVPSLELSHDSAGFQMAMTTATNVETPGSEACGGAGGPLPTKDSAPENQTASCRTPMVVPVVPATHALRAQDERHRHASSADSPNDQNGSTKKENSSLERPPAATLDRSSDTYGRLSLHDSIDESLVPSQALNGAGDVPDPTRDVLTACPLAKRGVLPMPLKPLAPLVTPPSQVLPGLIEPETEQGKRERAQHLKFMREALAMGSLALNTNETPVGCVLVYRGRVIAKGMNATNITRNGTRHAEFMAVSALLSHRPDAESVDESRLDEAVWGDVDPSDGHIFPYGQKLHPSPKVDRSIIAECCLYVTVEPCVMCASLLRQLRIKTVYFGAVNDKFGGTGGVFRIHMNSKPAKKPQDRPYQNGYGPADHFANGRAVISRRDVDDGDGGNVEPGFPAEGGYLRDEAVSLLRRFYVQENGRAPQPRKKEGRAARLFAMENAAANGHSISDLSDNGAPAETSLDRETLLLD